MSFDMILDFSLEDIKKYFTPRKWNKIAEYEKNKYLNVYSNYMHMLAEGFQEAPLPEFMNIKPIFASDTESSSGSEYEAPVKILRKTGSRIRLDRTNKPSTSNELQRRYPKRNVARKNYEEEVIIADDRYVYCDECLEDWLDYCKIHGDLIIIKDVVAPKDPTDKERALKTTPAKWMAVKPSRIAGLGVWSIRHIPDGIRFGPYEGELIASLGENNYSWQLRENGGKSRVCIDAGNPGMSNWMRYVNCARNRSEQNLMAFQYKGKIYYRTLHEILPHTELLVWYGPGFARQLGIDVKMYNVKLETPFPEKVFDCKYCRNRFSSPMYLEEHIKRCTMKEDSIKKGGIFICNYCKRGYSTSDFCEKHKIWCRNKYNVSANKHVFTEKAPTQNNQDAKGDALDKKDKIKCSRPRVKRHSCSVCSKQLKAPSHLANHMLIHTGERPHACKVCNSAFTEASNLKRHMRIHTGERPYKCSDCDGTFSDISALISHKRVHTGDRPYSCTQCDKSFAHSSSLTAHMRVHTGERPYSCTQCDKAFTHSGGLTAHMRVHTGEKPYSCTQCHKSFAYSSYLTIHMRVHSGERPYECKTCDKTYTASGGLRKHMKVHTDTLRNSTL